MILSVRPGIFSMIAGSGQTDGENKEHKDGRVGPQIQPVLLSPKVANKKSKGVVFSGTSHPLASGGCLHG